MRSENISEPVSIGLDLGGTTFAVGVLRASGALEGVLEADTHSHRARDEIVADLAKAISTKTLEARGAGHSVIGAGLGFPGVIDARAGLVIMPPNFGEGWKQFPLAKALTEATGLPTHLINDARAFTFAEARLGAAKGHTDVLGITLGTGVGGGLVLDGRLYIGKYCTAGEFGHQLYDPHGPSCGCGSPGCIEVYASGPSIITAAVRPLRQGRAPILREVIQGDLNRLSPKLIVQAAMQGDGECLEILDRAAHALAVGIANITHVINPEVVVIGGGVARAGDVLFDPIRRHVKHLARMVGRVPEIIPAALGDHAGLMGAAVWAREQAEAA